MSSSVPSLIFLFLSIHISNLSCPILDISHLTSKSSRCHLLICLIPLVLSYPRPFFSHILIHNLLSSSQTNFLLAIVASPSPVHPQVPHPSHHVQLSSFTVATCILAPFSFPFPLSSLHLPLTFKHPPFPPVLKPSDPSKPHPFSHGTSLSNQGPQISFLSPNTHPALPSLSGLMQRELCSLPPSTCSPFNHVLIPVLEFLSSQCLIQRLALLFFPHHA